jgi:N-acetylglucosaminyl-diphospho-decaprenol L-rhamnosyltransferase
MTRRFSVNQPGAGVSAPLSLRESLDSDSMTALMEPQEFMEVLSLPIHSDSAKPIISSPGHQPTEQRPATVTVSIVSHEHDLLIAQLMAQLCEVHGGLIAHVVLTHNLRAEPVPTPAAGWPFKLTQVFNEKPAGFGTNHNRAFELCKTNYFCVLNPDIELCDASVWPRLVHCMADPEVGCAYPALLNADGSRQENEREVVTPLALLRRHLLKNPVQRADWASAAFWLVPARAWLSLGGFDERYYMYCEDVDFCLRLQMAGWKLVRADATAVHYAGWNSRRISAYLGWHLSSLVRLWTQPTLRRYLSWRVDSA